MKVITNNNWRKFLYRHDVPTEIIDSDFGWTIDEYHECGSYEDGFIKYRGNYYHLDEFMITENPDLKDWDRFLSDKIFSKIAIKLSDDGKQYKIALILA